jgi:hypothetical protein
MPEVNRQAHGHFVHQNILIQASRAMLGDQRIQFGAERGRSGPGRYLQQSIAGLAGLMRRATAMGHGADHRAPPLCWRRPNAAADRD